MSKTIFRSDLQYYLDDSHETFDIREPLKKYWSGVRSGDFADIAISASLLIHLLGKIVLM